MDKKGYLSMIADTIGWFLAFLGVMIWAWILVGSSTAQERIIEGETEDVTGTGTLLSYLKVRVGDQDVGDLVIESIESGDGGAIGEVLEPIIQAKFGYATPVCWKMWYYLENKKELLHSVECSKSEDIFKAQTLLPLDPELNAIIELSVVGYR